MAARRPTPPATPPAIAAVLDFEGVGAGVGFGEVPLTNNAFTAELAQLTVARPPAL